MESNTDEKILDTMTDNTKLCDNFIYSEDYDYKKYDYSFILYLNDISKYPLLSYYEERELLIRYKKNNDMNAKERLINCNTRLVVAIAKRYYFYQVHIMDLISEGNIALIDAVDKFDITESCRLATYATWLIEKRIIRFIEKNSIIRIPAWKKQELNSYQRSKNDVYMRLGKEVIGVDELSKNLNLPVSMIIEYEKLLEPVLSINEKIHSDRASGDGFLNEIEYFISDPNSEYEDKIIEKIMFGKLIEKFFRYLNEKEKFVILARYGFYNNVGGAYSSIAKELYLHNITPSIITPQGVFDIENRALKKLRFYMVNMGVKNPFGKDIVLEKDDINLLRSKSNIYNYFYLYTKEQVDNAILALTDTQFNKLLSYYGYDLDNPVIDKTLSKNAVLYIKNGIIQKISDNLSKNVTIEFPQNLYDYFKMLGFDREKVNNILLSNDDIEILYRYYNLNLELIHSVKDVSLPEKKRLYSIILYIKGMLERQYYSSLNQSSNDKKSSYVKKKV